MDELNFEENVTPKGDEKDCNKKSNFQKYAENNSVGGLLYVLTSKSKIRRLIWLIIIVVCVAISLYLVRNSFSKLLNPPTSTTITNDPNLSLDFPAVTICSINAFSAKKLESYGINLQGVRDIYDYEPPENMDGFNIALTELMNTTASRFIEIEGCDFANSSCGIDDFDFLLKDLYACFTFNSGRKKPIRNVSGTGINQGLSFFFNGKEDDYVATIIGDAGARIVVHPQDEPPQPDRFGVAASPGTHMIISIKKLIFDDQTRRACLMEDQHKWLHLPENVSYSYAGCLEDSITDVLIHKCGCVLSTNYLSSD